MVHTSAGDLGVDIDYGRNQPGDNVQRIETGRWIDYRPDSEPVLMAV